MIVFVCLIGLFLILKTSPWPPLVTLRHIASFLNCDAARSLGLAPAHRGEPGYYPWHDRDNDNISCEQWPR
ncbi:MAG: excalibur calcium-binding domain-containing protein [Pseudomonadota bacterium]